MAITQNHVINIQPGVSAPLVIHCSQGDTGTQINLTVVNGDEEFDCSSYACSVHGVRSDGGNWGPITCTVSGSTVCFSLTSDMTAVAGACLAEISVGTVGTANFAMLMENATFESGVTYSNDVSVYQNILTAVQTGISNETAERVAAVETEKNERIAAVNAEATARQTADNTLQGNINSEASTRASADSNLQSQINQIIAPSGEAPSAAEVENARVAYDGETFPTLGGAIRAQVNNLHVLIDLIGSNNITPLFNQIQKAQSDINNVEDSLIDKFEDFLLVTQYKDYPVINNNNDAILDNNGNGLLARVIGVNVDDSFTSELFPPSAKAVSENYEDKFDYKKYLYIYGWDNYSTHVYLLKVDGTLPTTKADGKYNIVYSFDKTADSNNGIIGIQGQSSEGFPKKNYNLTFANKFVADAGWIAQKTYTLKGNFNDLTHARNIVSAKLWGQIVRSRDWELFNYADNSGDLILDNNGNSFAGYSDMMPQLVNGGATDGFPIALVNNDKYMGVYDFQIKKDAEMLGMGDGNNECILSCERVVDMPSVHFKGLAEIDGNDYDYEYLPDEDNPDWAKTSFNQMISSVMDSTGVNYKDTVEQYVDTQSALDYMIFTALIGGVDMVTKNFLMVTYDGAKWYFSAYDMDCTFGNWQDGSLRISPSTSTASLSQWNTANRLMHLIYTYDKDRLINRYHELRSTVLSENNIYNTFLRFMRRYPKALIDREVNIYPSLPSALEMNLNQILEFYRLRTMAIDAEVAALEAS